MFTGKPFIIDGSSGFGKLLVNLIPQEPTPNPPQLPFVIHHKRSWGDFVAIILLMPVLLYLVLTGCRFIAEEWQFSDAMLQVSVIISYTFLACIFWSLIPKIAESLTAVEITLEQEKVTWKQTKPFTRHAEVTTISLQEYAGIRHEAREVRANNHNNYVHEVHYVMLVHSDPARNMQLFAALTTKYIPMFCKEWSQLLNLSIVEPNELARQRMQELREFIAKKHARHSASIPPLVNEEVD